MKRATLSAWLPVIALPLLFSLFGCGYANQKTALELRIDSAVGKLPGAVDSSRKNIQHADSSKKNSSGNQHIDSTSQLTDWRLPRSAYLGYAYPPTIPRSVTRFFNAYVSIRYGASRIHDTLRTIISDQEGDQAQEDTIIIYPHEINFYRSIHIALLDPSGDFHIERIHSSDTQYVNAFRGNQWKWSVSTATDKKMATLVLKAEGLRSEGTTDDLDVRSIPVRITVKPDIARGFFDYLTDNPKVSVPIIVAFLSFIGWLIKYYLDKKKKNGK